MPFFFFFSRHFDVRQPLRYLRYAMMFSAFAVSIYFRDDSHATAAIRYHYFFFFFRCLRFDYFIF